MEIRQLVHIQKNTDARAAKQHSIHDAPICFMDKVTNKVHKNSPAWFSLLLM
jgi:hypothetical protein